MTMRNVESSPVAAPLRTWVLEGEPPITLSVYQPAVTFRCGDAPEVAINPAQVVKLCGYFTDLEDFFDSGDPEALR